MSEPESKTKDTFIRRYTSVAALIDILRRREIVLLDPQNWDDRNDRYFMKLYKDKKSLVGYTVFAHLEGRKLIIIGA